MGMRVTALYSLVPLTFALVKLPCHASFVGSIAEEVEDAVGDAVEDGAKKGLYTGARVVEKGVAEGASYALGAEEEAAGGIAGVVGETVVSEGASYALNAGTDIVKEGAP